MPQTPILSQMDSQNGIHYLLNDPFKFLVFQYFLSLVVKFQKFEYMF